MGLRDADLSDEKGIAEGGGVGSVAVSVVPCSICLEAVTDGGDRSTAKLQCGHQFHLDCIGSAFNAKGSMQCPNCRKIEKGNWLYSNGYRSYSEFTVDDWPHDEDLYDLNYTEMPYGVHWCPFSRLARIPSSFEEGESSPSLAYDLLGQHAVFAEHLANSSATHSCPYVAYFGPLQPSSSSGSQVSTENTVDAPAFHHHWNSLSGPVDVPTSHAFAAADIHYHGWDSHSPPYSQPSTRASGADHAPMSATNGRASRLDSDAHNRAGTFVHPFVLGHGSASRASSSAVTSMLPPYIASARGHVRAHELRASYQHHNTPGLHGPVFSGTRRSGSMRGLAPIGPTPPSEPAGFYLFASPAATNRSTQDTDASAGSQFYAWERDRFAPFPLLPVDRDFPWWGPLPQASGRTDSSSRLGFWPLHNSERSSSQSRPPHAPRMHPFI